MIHFNIQHNTNNTYQSYNPWYYPHRISPLVSTYITASPLFLDIGLIFYQYPLSRKIRPHNRHVNRVALIGIYSFYLTACIYLPHCFDVF